LSAVEAVVIGASAGAVEALSVLLPSLPATWSIPIVIVVHIPADRPSLLVELFRSKCRIGVCEIEDKEPLTGGRAYFAPPSYHVLVEPDRRLSLSCDEPVHFSRPSIDVLFESAADAFAGNLVGIVLSGANSDGAAGLSAICSRGGVGLVQRPGCAYNSTMPEAAIEACPEARVMSLDEISRFLADLPLGSAI
jgi:two-component system chemotaxis response regulator CheB